MSKKNELKGLDIFNGANMKLNDGNTYDIRFTMFTIALMEREFGSNNIFSVMFEPTYENFLKAGYFSLCGKQKEIRGREGDEIMDFMDDLVDETNFIEFQVVVLGEFNRFFMTMKNNESTLPEKYQKALDEMLEKQDKKK